jgi:hypothetical protein
MLLHECQRAAQQAGVLVLQAFVEGAAVAGRAFANAHGFIVFVHDLFLSRDARPFGAALPPGVRIRAYAPETSDDETWAALCNATLVRDAGFVPETATSVVGYTRMPGFFLAIAEADAPVGFCHVERRGAQRLYARAGFTFDREAFTMRKLLESRP